MNYLLSALFVLLCITLTKQDGPSATIIATPVDANDKPVKEFIPIEPDHNATTASPPNPKPTNATTPSPKPTNATTTHPPPTNATTTHPPPTNATTTHPPPTNATTTLPPPTNATTVSPTNGTTTSLAPPTNKTTVVPISTKAPATTAKPDPEHHRRFDGPSFVGGIVLALGLVAIGFVAFKFYKARIEVNYHTL